MDKPMSRVFTAPSLRCRVLHGTDVEGAYPSFDQTLKEVAVAKLISSQWLNDWR
jgi:hypothetical protein